MKALRSKLQQAKQKTSTVIESESVTTQQVVPSTSSDKKSSTKHAPSKTTTTAPKETKKKTSEPSSSKPASFLVDETDFNAQLFDDEITTSTNQDLSIPNISDSDDDFDEDFDDEEGTSTLHTKRKASSSSLVKKQEGRPSFADLGIAPWLEEHLAKLHIYMPTVIQEKCIPPTLAGKNVIGMSQTGSGKTAAFALPIIQNLAKDMYGIYALIITPARELAIQIKQHFEILAGDLPLRVALLVGGMDYLKQAHMLDSSPHIVVGTPGRIEDAIRTFSNDNYFKKIKYLVFDEADRIFSMDYSLDLDKILSVSNPKRQTLLYSATMNNQVKKLAKMAMSQSGKTKEEKEESLYIYDACKLFQLADNLSQYYLFMPEHVKDAYLVHLLTSLPDNTISMVFFSDIFQCELLNQACRLMGISCDSLHASKSQKERFAVLKYFRKRKLKFLFCTDVANRGLDIPAVGYVVNYDLPDTTDKYVHRVGRTARAGRLGICISLISQFEVKRVKAIEEDTGVKMEKYESFDESQAESEEFLISVAEHKCNAKLALLDSGFYDKFEQVKSKQQLTAELRKQAKIFFEMRSMQKLKSNSAKWKDRFSISEGVSNPSSYETEEKDQNTHEDASSKRKQYEPKSSSNSDVNIFGKKKRKL
ncbi:hypothetical protein C9374_004950 [Naegleria lovaniensis]|uniref:Probable eukaryotic initiation factor 4A n=1 Tax=Naegleria lovaniensis TaxID=51637 RepID=A0AA88KKG7_NAELO|nr:uncharacterized protein C9374_004950 [Naegleria lovaniensis]KAG2382983.1 hypothetical protein C9374_004950 [Naegleria lovaniensis]